MHRLLEPVNGEVDGGLDKEEEIVPVSDDALGLYLLQEHQHRLVRGASVTVKVNPFFKDVFHLILALGYRIICSWCGSACIGQLGLHALADLRVGILHRPGPGLL